MHSKTISSTDGTQLTLWEQSTAETTEAVLFVHGATYGTRAMYSLSPDQPREPSWFTKVTTAGRTCFGIDIRGYGQSEAPFSREGKTGAVRATTAAEDVLSAYKHIQERFNTIHIVAFSWGTIVVGSLLDKYEIEPATLALVAPVYEPPYDFEDATGNNAESDIIMPVRRISKTDARARWNSQIPKDPPAKHRFGTAESDPMFTVFWETVLDSDQRLDDSDEPTIVAPNGVLEDVRCACDGTPVYDASKISVPTVLLRGEYDTTATREDVCTLFDELGVDPSHKLYTEVGGGTHMLLYEKPRRYLFNAVENFQDTIKYHQ